MWHKPSFWTEREWGLFNSWAEQKWNQEEDWCSFINWSAKDWEKFAEWTDKEFSKYERARDGRDVVHKDMFIRFVNLMSNHVQIDLK